MKLERIKIWLNANCYVYYILYKLNFQITWLYPFKGQNLSKKKVMAGKISEMPYALLLSQQSQMICVLSFVYLSILQRGRVRYSFEHCLHHLIYLIHFPILLADTGSIVTPGGRTNKSSIDCEVLAKSTKLKSWLSHQHLHQLYYFALLN